MAGLKHSETARKGFFTRWFEAIAEARLRHAEHELRSLDREVHPQMSQWPRDDEDRHAESEKPSPKH
jgi:hypothetical protein